MKKEHIREQRLKEFSEHLKTGELYGVNRYNKFFKKVLLENNIENDKDIEKNEPIFLMPVFELPYIFDTWVFNKYGLPVYIENKEQDTIISFMQFFFINTTQFRHLFIKNWQLVDLYGGNELTDESTPADLAKNIDALITNINHYSALDSFNYKIYLN